MDKTIKIAGILISLYFAVQTLMNGPKALERVLNQQ
jgi:hypothetical protein